MENFVFCAVLFQSLYIVESDLVCIKPSNP